MDRRIKSGNDDSKNAPARASIRVLAKSEATKQSSSAPQDRIASLTLAMTSKPVLAAQTRPSFASSG